MFHVEATGMRSDPSCSPLERNMGGRLDLVGTASNDNSVYSCALGVASTSSSSRSNVNSDGEGGSSGSSGKSSCDGPTGKDISQSKQPRSSVVHDPTLTVRHQQLSHFHDYVHKQIVHADDGNVSSTQDESDVSSFVWKDRTEMGRILPFSKDDVRISAIEGPLPVQTSSNHKEMNVIASCNDNGEHQVHSVDDDEDETATHAPQLTTIPFLSLNVHCWNDDMPDDVSDMDSCFDAAMALIVPNIYTVVDHHRNDEAEPKGPTARKPPTAISTGITAAATTPSVWIKEAFMDMLPPAVQVYHSSPSSSLRSRGAGGGAAKTSTKEEFSLEQCWATIPPPSPITQQPTCGQCPSPPSSPNSDNNGSAILPFPSPLQQSLSPMPMPHHGRRRPAAGGSCIPFHIYIPTLDSPCRETDSDKRDTEDRRDDHEERLDDICGVSVATEHVTLQTEILDPTEPLFYTVPIAAGRSCSTENETNEHVALLPTELRQAADVLYQLLCQHWERPSCEKTVHEIVQCIQQHPETCQVRYPPMMMASPTSSSSNSSCTTAGNASVKSRGQPLQHYRQGGFGVGAVYPLSYFCVTACLPAIQAAYTAFPEAIGCADACLGLPLHYACHHAPPVEDGTSSITTACATTALTKSSVQVIQFLLSSFPDAVRRTNDVHQTPLHLACGRDNPCPDVVALLVAAYPAAALTFDDQGFTPLLQICRNNHSAPLPIDNVTTTTTTADDIVQILRMMCATSPLTVAAVTGSTMEKALHLAASAGAHVSLIEFLLQQDPGQCRYTDDSFQLPLHKAVQMFCQVMEPGINLRPSNSSALVAAQMLLQTVSLLTKAYPEGIHCTDTNDERPYDIARRMLSQNTQRPLQSTRDDGSINDDLDGNDTEMAMCQKLLYILGRFNNEKQC